MKKYSFSLLTFLLFFVFFTGTSHADTAQLDLTQLASNGNGKVTFRILNPPSGFDFSSLTANASRDNSNWAYSIWYEGGCPDACVVEWVGGGVPFYIKLTNQNSSITFNESVNGGAFNTPYTRLDLQQLSSDGTGKVTFKILNPPSGFDFSSLSSAGASWDNANWVYAIWYEGGCPDACVVEWQGQTTTPFYVKLANQTTSTIFNQSVSPALNAPPTVGTVIISSNPLQINTPVSATANFTDPGVLDTHQATINWGDGIHTNQPCTVTEPSDSTPGSVSCSLSSGYASANVYPVQITVQDNTGAQGQSPVVYASVYNPTQGSIFSTGQRFSNPASASPSTSGTVVFGLNYKYQGTMPVGLRAFSMDFNAANIHFNATTVSSLIISNGIATLTGTGTLNGSGTYNYVVTGMNGGGVRIQITDSSNNVVYDSQPGDPITATPTTSVSGQVIVH